MSQPVCLKSNAEIYMELCERRQLAYDWIVQLGYRSFSGYTTEQREYRRSMYEREYEHLTKLISIYEAKSLTDKG